MHIHIHVYYVYVHICIERERDIYIYIQMDAQPCRSSSRGPRPPIQNHSSKTLHVGIQAIVLGTLEVQDNAEPSILKPSALRYLE